MTEPLREGLSPVVADGTRVLVLGSFPSERSLAVGEYYANRRNQFWQLMGAVFDIDVDMPYDQRIEALTGHGVALWDVIHSCRRVGSMDAKIDQASVVINDFAPLLSRHPGIERIFANGSTAATLYAARVHTGIEAVRLPSSSGALPMSLVEKAAQWRAVV
ncbi:DNA-deoxyinosine glycosylase [Mycobacterium yunnanensis]|uniref:DNA-deoxyinosine glycosylase n=1 Tax=Mycobacterium yunnanensis TaxID=368477 RepID=A0A9X2YYF7_9MYCO|nr:DNA-deoxyinosine glycosylase [Mycobacterium yunnanensis]MCV7419866.1 DNA-deoxyinosine glycosylase [Mycobacterium yunnanensis]